MPKRTGKLRIVYPNKSKPGSETNFEKRLPVVFMTKKLTNKLVCVAVVKNAAAADSTTAFVSAKVIVQLLDHEIHTVNLALSSVAATDNCHLFAHVLKGSPPSVPGEKEFHGLNCPRIKVNVHHT
jgi:hypothetical protein